MVEKKELIKRISCYTMMLCYFDDNVIWWNTLKLSCKKHNRSRSFLITNKKSKYYDNEQS